MGLDNKLDNTNFTKRTGYDTYCDYKNVILTLKHKRSVDEVSQLTLIPIASTYRIIRNLLGNDIIKRTIFQTDTGGHKKTFYQLKNEYLGDINLTADNVEEKST